MSVPPLVAAARSVADAQGFDGSCSDEVGALLHVLAGRRGVLRVAEIGSGAGVGTAWLASALPPGVPLVTVELDPARAAAVGALFAEDPDVTVLTGSWEAALAPYAPFDLVFVDAADAKDAVDRVLGLVLPGATLVLDDLSSDWEGPDARRTQWLEHPRLASVVLGTGGTAQVLVALVSR